MVVCILTDSVQDMMKSKSLEKKKTTTRVLIYERGRKSVGYQTHEQKKTTHYNQGVGFLRDREGERERERGRERERERERER